MRLGSVSDHDVLTYDQTLYEFRIGGQVVSFEDVQRLDLRGHVRWGAPEQRDWFHKLNPHDLKAHNERALQGRGKGVYDDLSPDQRIQEDAKRNDSILAGKIIDADPALVRAVADALEQQGLVGSGAAGASPGGVSLPQGMEALSQLQGQEGRKMTLMEHVLMRQILRNDDKAKLRREKRADALQERQKKAEAKDADTLKKHSKIGFHQLRKQKQDAQAEEALRVRSANMQVEKVDPQQGGMSIDQALTMAEQGISERLRMPVSNATAVSAQDRYADTSAAGGPYLAGVQDSGAKNPSESFFGMAPPSSPGITYTDSYGNPIRPEADAMRPSMSQIAYGANVVSEEEKALAEMRARNLAEQSRYEMGATGVPGMQEAVADMSGGGAGGAKGGKRNAVSALINGHEVNADGTPKESKFDKFTSGLGKITSALSPLVGGRGGGPGGGGGMGGGPGGGGGGSGMGMGGAGGGGGMGGMGMGGGMGGM